MAGHTQCKAEHRLAPYEPRRTRSSSTESVAWQTPFGSQICSMLAYPFRRIGAIEFMDSASASRYRLRVRQELDSVHHVNWVENLGNQLQVANGLPDGDSQLLGIDHACEIAPVPEPFGRQFQEVIVLGKHGSPHLRGAVENLIV